MAHTGSMRFEWDPAKDRANRKKHGLGFAEARELFHSDADILEIFDEAHKRCRSIAAAAARVGADPEVEQEDAKLGRDRDQLDPSCLRVFL